CRSRGQVGRKVDVLGRDWIVAALADLDRHKRILVDDAGRGIGRPAIQVLTGAIHQIPGRVHCEVARPRVELLRIEARGAVDRACRLGYREKALASDGYAQWVV